MVVETEGQSPVNFALLHSTSTTHYSKEQRTTQRLEIMADVSPPLSSTGLSNKVQGIISQVRTIVDREIIPLEPELSEWYRDPATKEQRHPKLQELKEKMREEGLWNMGITKHTDPTGLYGECLSNVEYSYICQELGRSILYAPGVFNCGAPGTPDAEVLIRYGTEEQRRQWLTPLVEGRGGSCFAMTEPNVASSDASNIQSSIRREGDNYVINGRKWWISGASDSGAQYCLFMGRTDSSAPRHRQHSLVIVPLDLPGVTITRDLTVIGYDDAPHKHAELIFDNVRVPTSNLIYEEGRGFEIGQARLGCARVHHCMRIIGASERALHLMTERAQIRVAFGRALSTYSSVQQDIAKSRVELEQARLLVLKTAHMMDQFGNRAASDEIAMIKLVVPKMACTVIDRAIQVHGGLGVCQDTPLPHMYALARAMRIFDGPDEVHCRTIAGYELRRQAGSRL